MSAIPVKILLVEDNPGDVRLIQEALKEGKVCNELMVVQDGDAAMDYLFKKGDFTEAARPDLILLDLNLPKKSGKEVLTEIKTDEDLRRIPVIILTTSKAESDVLETYNNHANCYVVKPVGMESFVQIVAAIKNFWFAIVKLPEK